MYLLKQSSTSRAPRAIPGAVPTGIRERLREIFRHHYRSPVDGPDRPSGRLSWLFLLAAAFRRPRLSAVARPGLSPQLRSRSQIILPLVPSPVRRIDETRNWRSISSSKNPSPSLSQPSRRHQSRQQSGCLRGSFHARHLRADRRRRCGHRGFPQGEPPSHDRLCAAPATDLPTAASSRRPPRSPPAPPADMVTQLLNFGLPAPIDIQIDAQISSAIREIATDSWRCRQVLRHRRSRIESGRFDYPTFKITVDRTKSAQSVTP